MTGTRKSRQSGPLPDPREEPTISVDQAARVLGLSARAVYAAIHDDKLPVIKVGRAMSIPTAKFLR